MTKLIRKHQKKILAFFGVGLMIAFAAQSGYNRGGGRGGNDAVIAHFNGGDIYASELAQSNREWGALKTYLRQYTFRVLAVRTADQSSRGTDPLTQQSMQTAFNVEEQIDQNHDLFYLLAKEGRDAGVQPDGQMAQQLLALAKDSLPPDDYGSQELLRDAVSDLLTIRANFDRIANDVKVSQPQRERVMVSLLEKMVLNVVPLPASNFAAKVPPPTTQQIEDQFNNYKNVSPGNPSNPFGFGYRLPERVKLQYIQIDRASAQKVVKARKSDYDWDVDARKYYLLHPDAFASTQPTTAPTTQAARPYSEVSADATDAVQKPLVDALMSQVLSRISTKLQADWHNYTLTAAAHSTTDPSVDITLEGYPSYLYLRKLSKLATDEFGVDVELQELDNNQQGRSYLSEPDLMAQLPIGAASANPDNPASPPFSTLAMQQADAYLKRPDWITPAAQADLMKPSQPLQDKAGNFYIFRLTDARPAEAAFDLAATTPEIISDLRKAAGFQIAKDTAGPLLAAAQNNGLKPFATALGYTMVTTSPFSLGAPDVDLPGLITRPELNAFIQQAQQLLTKYDPTSNPHPAELISIPPLGLLYVAQLENVSADWNSQNFYQLSLDAAGEVRAEQEIGLMRSWFTPDNVIARNGFQLKNQKKSDE